MPGQHSLYEERSACYRAYATDAYATEMHKKREDARYNITPTEILMEACDKIVDKKNEVSHVTAAVRISDKQLQALLLQDWQPWEQSDLHAAIQADDAERNSQRRPSSPPQALDPSPSMRAREARSRRSSAFTSHVAASGFLAGVLDRQRMAEADAEAMEHQRIKPQPEQWAQEPAAAASRDKEDGSGFRVRTPNNAQCFLRKAISEKARTAARWQLMQPESESPARGTLTLPGMGFDKARAGLQRLSSVTRSSISSEAEAFLSQADTGAWEGGPRQPHPPIGPPTASWSEDRGSYTEDAGTADTFLNATITRTGSDVTDRRASLEDRLGGVSPASPALGIRRPLEIGSQDSSTSKSTAAALSPTPQPVLSRTNSRRSSVTFFETILPTEVEEACVSPSSPTTTLPSISPQAAAKDVAASKTKRRQAESGSGPFLAIPSLADAEAVRGPSASATIDPHFRRSSLDMSMFAPPSSLASSIRRSSVDLPLPAAGEAARFKSSVHRLRRGSGVMHSADAVSARFAGLEFGGEPSKLGAGGASPHPRQPALPSSPAVEQPHPRVLLRSVTAGERITSGDSFSPGPAPGAQLTADRRPHM